MVHAVPDRLAQQNGNGQARTQNAKSTDQFAGLSVVRDSISDPAFADFLEH